MDKIKFANGEEHSCTFCSTIPPTDAFIAVDDIGFAEAASLFSDPSKTNRIEFADRVLTGYTRCFNLSVQPYGVQAALRGGTVSMKESEMNTL